MARILVVGSYAESLINFRGLLLAEMVRNGHEVFAAAPDASEQVRSKLSALQVHYCHINMKRTGMNPFQDLITLFSLRDLFREIKPDVFLGYTIKPVCYGSLAASSCGVPSLYSIITGLGYAFIGSTAKQKIVNSIARRIYKNALKRNRKVFFQNPDDRQLFLSMKLLQEEKKAELINGSGVDLAHFAPAPLPDNICFLLIARLIREKGIYEYVEAARRVKEEHSEIHFRLAGWLDDSPTSINSLDLERWQQDGTIDYLGRLEDVRPAIINTSVYVLPSYREGTPRTVLEAMAMGRPVITTDTPGCRETVCQGENGFLFPVRDVKVMVSCMEKFIENPSLIEQMGKESRKIAEKKYDVHEVNRNLLDKMNLLVREQKNVLEKNF